MGLFANTMFSVLLGWVETAASWLWSLITNTDVHAWLRWLLDNWLALVILLCLAGAVVDFIVYLFRWQPYRVWAGALRWMKARKAAEKPAEEHVPFLQRRWVYADGSTELEAVPMPHPRQAEVQEEQFSQPIRPMRRVVRQESPEQAYHQPVYPPQWHQNSQDEQGGTQ